MFKNYRWNESGMKTQQTIYATCCIHNNNDDDDDQKKKILFSVYYCCFVLLKKKHTLTIITRNWIFVNFFHFVSFVLPCVCSRVCKMVWRCWLSYSSCLCVCLSGCHHHHHHVVCKTLFCSLFVLFVLLYYFYLGNYHSFL